MQLSREGIFLAEGTINAEFCTWDELGMVQEQRDGLGDGGRVSEGRRERMREQGLAWVRREGQHLKTLRRCWLFEAGVQSKTIRGQKCNWVRGLIL